MYFSGFSGSGKTTLITKLIEEMKEFDIGYLKHDAHKFAMDKEGKDTWKATKAGAQRVAITSKDQDAYILKDEDRKSLLRPNFNNCDMVFIEGFKENNLPKILMLGDGTILDKNLENVVALVGEQSSSSSSKLPYFHRDDIKGIKNFILKHFEKIINDIPLYGLILAGGKSTRMGQDKAALNYHGVGQIDHTHKLLRNFTKHAFVSCRKEQEFLPHLKYHLQIHDRIFQMGPSGGIISAMLEHKHAAWLVVACDLPFLDEETIETLIKKRNPFKVATCYKSSRNDFPEPLCAIYEPKARETFFQYFSLDKTCPRKVLINSNTKKIKLDKNEALANINTPMEYQKAREQIEFPGIL
jgi:molybdopterin-guanine dinucleotide biosynthesis protein MobB